MRIKILWYGARDNEAIKMGAEKRQKTLWRSVKYEGIYLRAHENGRELQAGLSRYFDFYNRRRTHQAHDYQTPDEIYYATDACGPLAVAA